MYKISKNISTTSMHNFNIVKILQLKYLRNPEKLIKIKELGNW